MLIASKYGGMDIEAVARETPTSILKAPASARPNDETLEKVAGFLGFEKAQLEEAKDLLRQLVAFFYEKDALMAEINPLVLSKEGKLCCVDSKLSFDDNAAFRQAELFALRDYSQEDPREVTAAQYDLNYIGLTGNIGCMVNGAGLAMATMDLIHLHGGEPANFMDVGGGATARQVSAAMKMLVDDKNVCNPTLSAG